MRADFGEKIAGAMCANGRGMRLRIALGLVLSLAMGCSSQATGDASDVTDASSDTSLADTSTPAIDAGGNDAAHAQDAGSDAAALPLGTVSNVNSSSCGQNATCTTLTVDCPGIDSIGATLQITASATADRTVVVIGPGGGTAFYSIGNLVADYVAHDFRVVQIKWDQAWELAKPAGIKAAACRPATLYHWVHDNVHVGGASQAYCVHGSSGGSGAVGYALSHYNVGDIVDYALMSFGPVFSEIQYGCDPSLYSGHRNLCPQLTDAPFAYNVNNNAPSVNAWEGTNSCVVGKPTQGDIDGWTTDSIDTGGSFDFPKTGTSFYYCVPANAGAGLGSFYIDKVNAASKSVTCFTDCSDEALTAGDVKQMTDDVAKGCVPNH